MASVDGDARRPAGWRRGLRRLAPTLVLSLLVLGRALALPPGAPASTDVAATVERARTLAQTAPVQVDALLRSLGDPAALPSDALRGRYFEARGVARANLQQAALALEDFHTALRFATAAGDQPTIGRARLGGAWVTEAAQGFAAAQPLYEAALAYTRSVGDQATEALIHATRARGATVFDQIEVALQSVRAAQAIAATVTLDAGTRGTAAFSAAWVARRAGDHAAAGRYFEEALAAARAAGDRSAEGDIAIAMADLEHELGRDEPALQLAERARADYVALRDEVAVGVADIRASASLLALGRAGEARARARAGLARLAAVDNPVIAQQALLALAGAEIEVGDHAAALRTLARARELIDGNTPAGTRASFQRLWARANAAAGNFAAAFAALEESLRWQRQDTAVVLSTRTAAQRALLDFERLAREKAALQVRAQADADRLAASQQRTVMLAALLTALVALIVALVYGVARQRWLNRQVSALAATDHLTGIPNRRQIDEAGAAMIAARRRTDLPLAVIELDIDDFKAINDRHGHAAGDAVLQAVARLLRAELRDADRVGRYGGDEFLVLLPSLAGADAAAVAERLRAAVQVLDVRSGGSPVPLTVSVGVTGATAADRSYDEVVRRADAALYEAKARGRNCVVVAPAPAPAADAEPAPAGA